MTYKGYRENFEPKKFGLGLFYTVILQYERRNISYTHKQLIYEIKKIIFLICNDACRNSL